jgi:hypothetical protein
MGQVKIRYSVAVGLYAIGVGFLLLGSFSVGVGIACGAFGLAFGTAETNGHLTQYGKKK